MEPAVGIGSRGVITHSVSPVTDWLSPTVGLGDLHAVSSMNLTMKPYSACIWGRWNHHSAKRLLLSVDQLRCSVVAGVLSRTPLGTTNMDKELMIVQYQLSSESSGDDPDAGR